MVLSNGLVRSAKVCVELCNMLFDSIVLDSDDISQPNSVSLSRYSPTAQITPSQ